MNLGYPPTTGSMSEVQALTDVDPTTDGTTWSRLADEQAALRRVATLVARGAPSIEVFAAVAEEVARCVGAEHAVLHRYDADGTTVMVAARDDATMQKMPVGERFSLEGDNVNAMVMRSGRPARIDDYAKASGSTAERLRKLGLRSAAGAPIVVDGQLWGTAIVGSSRAEPLPPDTEARIADFADLAATAIANAENYTKLVRSREQQAGLRRVATLVARGATAAEVFGAVTDELARCLGAQSGLLLRYEPDGTFFVLATHDCLGLPKLPIHERFPLAGDNVASLVHRSERPARMNCHQGAAGPAAARIREIGVRSGVGAPIIVDGHVWGAAIVCSSLPDPFPLDTETRLAEFTDLVATAIANAKFKEEVMASRERQAGLRRVATLVARGATASEVFEAVTQEVAGCLGGAESALLLRYEPEGTYCVLATRDQPGLPKLPLGEHFPLGDDSLGGLLFRTGRPARVDAHDDAAARIREFGLHSGVGAPVIVDGHLWGAAIVGSSRPEPLPPDTESRIAEFTDLVATAIGNAETQAELQASRARIVAAGDAARRRLERDLHDGAQQRLICLGLQLREIEDAVPANLAELKRQIADTTDGLVGVSRDLQEVSRGIHPAIRSKGGLGPTLNALALCCAVPVVVDFRSECWLPESIEVAAYYLVAEALTNSAKHARASKVTVCVMADGPHLHVSIRDNGIGGANPRNGSGLVGLTDRIEALGGHLRMTSHVGQGTTLLATIPIN